MSYTRSDDYFSFMAERHRGKDSPQMRCDAASAQDVFTHSDVVEFIEEAQIEVSESVISDTMIQRIFGRFRTALPMALED